MEEDEKTRLLKLYSEKPTDELLDIWVEKDTGEWSENTIEIIGSVLEKRGVSPPTQISETREVELHTTGDKFRFDWTVVVALVATFTITFLVRADVAGYNIVPFLIWSPFVYLLFRKVTPIERAIALSLLFLVIGKIQRVLASPVQEWVEGGMTGEDPPLVWLFALFTFAPLPLAVVMLVKGAFREINMGKGRKKPKKNAPSVRTKPSTMPKTEPAERPTSKPAVKPKKKEPVKTEKPQMSSAHDDEKFYEQVAAELEEGSRKKGLWLKAETKAGGDEDKARLLYIEWRVEQLSDEEKKRRS